MSDVIEKYVCNVNFEKKKKKNEYGRFTSMGVLPHVTLLWISMNSITFNSWNAKSVGALIYQHLP